MRIWPEQTIQTLIRAVATGPVRVELESPGDARRLRWAIYNATRRHGRTFAITVRGNTVTLTPGETPQMNIRA